MGMLKGEKEYRKFLEGQPLTRKEAMLAHCYQCNGLGESRADCQGYSCPLYQYAPYRKNDPQTKAKITAALETLRQQLE